MLADNAPSRINLCHWNNWFGRKPHLRSTADMHIPGCSVSSTMGFFSHGHHRRPRCTTVMTSTCPIDTFFLVIVPSLYLFQRLISRFKGVRLKWWLLQNNESDLQQTAHKNKNYANTIAQDDHWPSHATKRF